MSRPIAADESPAFPEPADDDSAFGTARPLLRGWIHLGALCVFVVAGPVLAAQAPTPWTAVALAVYAVSIVALSG